MCPNEKLNIYGGAIGPGTSHWRFRGTNSGDSAECAAGEKWAVGPSSGLPW